MVIGAVLALWLLGSERGLLGAAVGAFIGALAAAGLVTATTGAELASMYTPVEMTAGVVPLGVVALVLAVALPYATGTVALAWTVGAVVAATAAPRTGQVIYLAPLLLHAAVAALVVRVAARRVGWADGRSARLEGHGAGSVKRPGRGRTEPSRGPTASYSSSERHVVNRRWL